MSMIRRADRLSFSVRIIALAQLATRGLAAQPMLRNNATPQAIDLFYRVLRATSATSALKKWRRTHGGAAYAVDTRDKPGHDDEETRVRLPVLECRFPLFGKCGHALFLIVHREHRVEESALEAEAFR